MDNIKVMSVFGTRPEAIKMAPLIKKLEQTQGIESIVCVTAQHREMLDQVLEIFDLHPQYDLNIMQPRQTLATITTKALNGLSEVMQKVKPDLVLVHGDTTTTFSGALGAYYNQIKVGHVEAGLRTYDKYQPFPEEINRCLTSQLTDLHFAPTTLAKQHLLKENINGIRISTEREEMGIYKSFNYEIFERRNSIVLAFDGNSPVSNLVQEAKNGKGKAKIYVNSDVEALKDKASSLGGYVKEFKISDDLAQKILDDYPEIGTSNKLA